MAPKSGSTPESRLRVSPAKLRPLTQAVPTSLTDHTETRGGDSAQRLFSSLHGPNPTNNLLPPPPTTLLVRGALRPAVTDNHPVRLNTSPLNLLDLPTRRLTRRTGEPGYPCSTVAGIESCSTTSPSTRASCLPTLPLFQPSFQHGRDRRYLPCLWTAFTFGTTPSA